jgi:hypothetical protein
MPASAILLETCTVQQAYGVAVRLGVGGGGVAVLLGVEETNGVTDAVGVAVQGGLKSGSAETSYPAGICRSPAWSQQGSP